MSAGLLLILLVASAFAMAWTLQSRTLRAFAALAVGIASVGVTAYDNSRYDNVSTWERLDPNLYLRNANLECSQVVV